MGGRGLLHARDQTSCRTVLTRAIRGWGGGPSVWVRGGIAGRCTWP
nr:MAG TPA: hypothetical protein [Caudoviricetes sp.]